jgi:hypothetical protein
MRHAFRITLIVMCLAVLTGGTASTRREFVLIASSDISAKTEEDTTIGQYYTVSYRLPANLQVSHVERAVLELYVDVRAKVRDDYRNEAPMLEVYALKSRFSGSVAPGELDAAICSARPVARGRGRRVLIDITEIFRAHLSGRLNNNGIVVGTLTGARDGDFTILSNRLPGNAVGRLRIFTNY